MNYKKNRRKLVSKMKRKLTNKRFNHSLNVEKVAIELSKIYGGNSQKVSIAAILHDNAKNYSDDKKMKLVKKYNIPLSMAEKSNIDLVHAKLGSVIANNKYKIYDKDILNAVKYHTTGRPNMSLTEKIIYIADFIEPDRKSFPGLEKVRKMAYNDLNATLVKILMLTINHVVNRGQIIDDITKKTYEYYYKINSKNF